MTQVWCEFVPKSWFFEIPTQKHSSNMKQCPFNKFLLDNKRFYDIKVYYLH